ncbi:sugar phosphate isomerase/epimerase family protein [Effusibacillus consociatus]|uniref:Sugar phosphate isomerase/epimerase family protein n=1 Tax=Effusibacillus consociatus TaxID=1117041 RepID=A0ABV9Q3A4_9BACL
MFQIEEDAGEQMKSPRLVNWMEKSKIPPGLQLYTVRDELVEDFFGTLGKIAEMGYQTVEFAGYYGIPADEMKKALDDFGLQGVSSHVAMQTLEKELIAQIKYSLTIGGKYIVIPSVGREQLTNEQEFRTLVSSIQKIGKEVRQYGLQLAYHNHAFEFEKIGGMYLLDRLLHSVSANVLQLELDLFWVKKAGLDPAMTLNSYKGRVPLIHVKDMDREGDFTEVGRGIIDYRSVFPIARDVGVQYYFVEQDFSRLSPLESAKLSIDYLISIGAA